MTADASVRAADATTDWWKTVCGNVDRRTRRRLRTLGSEYVYMSDSVIVSEGSRADRFFLIIHGEVDVMIDGEVVNTLDAGDFFGEVALIHAQPVGPGDSPVTIPRTATVRARKATRVRELDGAELMTMMEAAPSAASRISSRAVGRLAARKL